MFRARVLDDSKLRAAAEITFRTILADWYSGAFLNQDRSTQRRVVRRMRSKLGKELPRALADPPAWMRNKIFELFLNQWAEHTRAHWP